MPNQDLQPFSLNLELPLCCTKTDESTSLSDVQITLSSALLQYQIMNEGVFRVERDPGLTPVAQRSLDRLDAKLDLLLHLQAQHALQSNPLPPAYKLELSTSSIRWLANEAMKSGQFIFLQLFLVPNMPQPITLPAVVKRCIDLEQHWQIEAEITPLPAKLADVWEQSLFLLQRKQLKLSRT